MEEFIKLIIEYNLISIIISFGVSIVAVILSIVKRKGFLKDFPIDIISITVSILLWIVVGGILFQYTYVPNIINLTKEQAILKLNDYDINYNLNDFTDSDSKIVHSVKPDVGKILKKGDMVSIKMINRGSEVISYSTVVDEDTIISYNANRVEFYVSDVGIRLKTSNKEYSTDIGNLALSGAEISLIDYNADKIIMKKRCDYNGHIAFENIPSGTYIYKVTAKGYEEYQNSYPFKLDYNPALTDDVLVWGINLNDTVEFYENEFNIKLIDKSGNPIVNKEASVGIKKRNEDSNVYSSYPLRTNSDGYLCIWHMTSSSGTATEYLELVTFELKQGYIIEVFDENICNTIDEITNTNVYEVVF